MGDKWKTTPLKYARTFRLILDQNWNIGKSPGNLMSQPPPPYTVQSGPSGPPKDDVGVTPTVIFDLTFRCGDFSGKMMGKFFSLPKLVQKSWHISEG